MIDLALTTKFCFQGLHAHAVRLHAAVPAALTHQLIDHHARAWIHHGAAFATATFFGGAHLVINDDGAAFYVAQLFLQPVELIAVVHGHAFWKPSTRALLQGIVFFRLVCYDDCFNRAFGPHGLGNLHHRMAFRAFANLLAASHGDGVVVQDFVGDVHTCRNRLANGQQAAVKVSAVTQIGKDVGIGGERLLANPRHALTAHLREPHGAAVHPQRHVMAPNAGHGT